MKRFAVVMSFAALVAFGIISLAVAKDEADVQTGHSSAPRTAQTEDE
jgi:hypothetical protein